MNIDIEVPPTGAFADGMCLRQPSGDEVADEQRRRVMDFQLDELTRARLVAVTELARLVEDAHWEEEK